MVYFKVVGLGEVPLLILGKKDEMTKERKAGKASITKPGSLLSSRLIHHWVIFDRDTASLPRPMWQ